MSCTRAVRFMVEKVRPFPPAEYEIRVVGSCAELGEWHPAHGKQCWRVQHAEEPSANPFHTKQLVTDLWECEVLLELPEGGDGPLDVHYKYVAMFQRGQHGVHVVFEGQNETDNRTLRVLRHGEGGIGQRGEAVRTASSDSELPTVRVADAGGDGVATDGGAGSDPVGDGTAPSDESVQRARNRMGRSTATARVLWRAGPDSEVCATFRENDPSLAHTRGSTADERAATLSLYDGTLTYADVGACVLGSSGGRRLLCGSCPRTVADMKELASLGVTAVLNLQENSDIARTIDSALIRGTATQGSRSPALALHRLYSTVGVLLSHCPMVDFSDRSKTMHLPDAVFLLRGLMRAGHNTYVHCTAGIGRAVAVVCAYLHWCEEQELGSVFARMQQARPQAYLRYAPIINAERGFKEKFGAL